MSSPSLPWYKMPDFIQSLSSPTMIQDAWLPLPWYKMPDFIHINESLLIVLSEYEATCWSTHYSLRNSYYSTKLPVLRKRQKWVNENLRSGFMPTSRHFFNRQAGQCRLVYRSITQLPLASQENLALLLILRPKKLLQLSQETTV